MQIYAWQGNGSNFELMEFGGNGLFWRINFITWTSDQLENGNYGAIHSIGTGVPVTGYPSADQLVSLIATAVKEDAGRVFGVTIQDNQVVVLGVK